VVDAGLASVVRVDGSAAPLERVDARLSGYRGARPVRFGNAAADQLQLDVAGELLEFAAALAAAGALPDALAGAVAPLVRWIERHWNEPDHGIWEIRGTPRRYTHSRVMAWVGLDRAAGLAESGRVAGDAASWRALASHIRTLTCTGAALDLYGTDSGADAALSAAVTNGFLDPRGDIAAATLDLVAHDLEDGGLVHRYRGARDEISDPCAPFVFPTFWLAWAEAAAGRDEVPWLAAAVATGSPLGLYGEVRDPDGGGPFGNFPQVQSHAALVQALIDAPEPITRRW
jgi:GH15 family glucan-1,4-alpha-glucosidase